MHLVECFDAIFGSYQVQAMSNRSITIANNFISLFDILLAVCRKLLRDYRFHVSFLLPRINYDEMICKYFTALSGNYAREGRNF